MILELEGALRPSFWIVLISYFLLQLSSIGKIGLLARVVRLAGTQRKKSGGTDRQTDILIHYYIRWLPPRKINYPRVLEV